MDFLHYRCDIPVTCYKGNTPSWQKKEAKFRGCLWKQDIETRVSRTYCNSDTHSWPMEKENAVLCKISAACYSGNIQNHPKRETDNNESAGFLSPNATPLLFFYDTESTGGNVHYDHIIEIAAEVVGPSKSFITVRSFSELCCTSYSLLGTGMCQTQNVMTCKPCSTNIY